MLAALPLAVLAGSPQRVLMSAVIAAGYVVAAALTFRNSRTNRLMIVYVAVVAAWMIASWLRSHYLLHLNIGQLTYATSKTAYFVAIVLPMSAAVAIMVGRTTDVWSTATSQVLIGVAIAILTVAFLGDRILGASRYTWQGNLIALGTVVAIQPWPIRNIKASAAIGLLGVLGIMLANSRQSLAAVVVALVLSAIYWIAASYFGETGSMWSRLQKSPSSPYAALSLVLLLVAAAYIGATYAAAIGARIDAGGVHSSAPSVACHCVTDRIVSIQSNAGDRDTLLLQAVTLFTQNPVLGTGLGSYAGRVRDTSSITGTYQYPHNVPLEILSETGVIGFLVTIAPLLVTWAALFWTGIKRASPSIAGLVMIVVVFFVVANLSGDIPSDRGMWIFGIVALKLGLDAWQRRSKIPRNALPQQVDANLRVS